MPCSPLTNGTIAIVECAVAAGADELPEGLCSRCIVTLRHPQFGPVSVMACTVQHRQTSGQPLWMLVPLMLPCESMAMLHMLVRLLQLCDTDFAWMRSLCPYTSRLNAYLSLPVSGTCSWAASVQRMPALSCERRYMLCCRCVLRLHSVHDWQSHVEQLNLVRWICLHCRQQGLHTRPKPSAAHVA